MRRRTLFSLGTLALLACASLGFGALGAADAAAAASGSTEVAAVSAVGSVHQSPDDFRFASLDANYTLGRDDAGRSTLSATETLVAVFPEIDQNRGIRRAIPLHYDGHPIDLRIESVTDANGVPRSFETERDDDDEFLLVTIAADDFVHGEQSYVITYTAHNVTLNPDNSDSQEFYWDVNGTGWAQPFDRVTARVAMATELGSAFTGDAACYRGPEGSTQTCDKLQIEDSLPPTVVAEAATLGAFENLTVAVAFAPDTFVERDSSLAASPAGVIGVATGVLSLGGLAAALVARRTRWRDAAGRGIVIAEYEPPAGVDPLLAADLLARGTKGITATILDLAVSGAVRIIETKKGKFAVELVNPQLVAATARSLVDALFGENAAVGARRKLGESDSSLATKLYAVSAAAHKRSTAEGYRRRVGGGLRFAIGAAVLLLTVVSVILSVIALESERGGGWPVLVIIVSICALIFTLIALIGVRPLTQKGAIAREQLKGLELYIRLAEADRLRVLQSPSGALRDAAPLQPDVTTPEQPLSTEQVLRLHEKLLPYAVLFGLEKQWAAELASLYTQGGNDPAWYSSTSGFNVALFAAGVGSFASASSTAWSGSGASSSSSGASGGGSSGGGGGGGGGGGV